MKLKYYLRGLGTGILFATLILFISYGYRNTDAQIKQRAKELGMVEPGDERTTVIPEGFGEKTENTKEETSEGDTTTGRTETSEATSESTTEVPTTEEPDTTEMQTTTDNQSPVGSVTEYEFSIVRGMDSAQVARLLESAGAIDNAEDFDRYLIENGYSSRIKVGNFKIKDGCTYQDIALLITN